MFFSSEKCAVLDLFFLFEYIMGVRYFSEFGFLRGVLITGNGWGDFAKNGVYHPPHPVHLF